MEDKKLIENNNIDHFLSLKQQLLGFVIGIVLSIFVLSAVGYLIYVAPKVSENQKIPPSENLTWACIAGFLGGAARALFKFIWEVGGPKGNDALWYLHRWFLYLLKPFMGLAGGVLFFLIVNQGLVTIFAEPNNSLDFWRVILTSSLGGLFFENVFNSMLKLMPGSEKTQELLEEWKPSDQ